VGAVKGPEPATPVPRSGVAVVSVWYETDERGPRARIIAESGGAERRREVFAAAGVDEICHRLRDWLVTLRP
jgi:hypothetical protein